MQTNISFLLLAICCGFLTIPILWILVSSFPYISHFLGIRMFCRLHPKARSQQNSIFFFHRWLCQRFFLTLSQSFKCVSSVWVSVYHVYLWAYVKLAWELWSRMLSLSFNWAMHIKWLGAVLKLGFIHSQIEFGSAGCLEKEHEKEYYNFWA